MRIVPPIVKENCANSPDNTEDRPDWRISAENHSLCLPVVPSFESSIGSEQTYSESEAYMPDPA